MLQKKSDHHYAREIFSVILLSLFLLPLGQILTVGDKTMPRNNDSQMMLLQKHL